MGTNSLVLNDRVASSLDLNSRTKRVNVNGRWFIVAPLTMIVPGVLPGSKGPLYYPPEEVAHNHKVWNYTPIVVYHPYDHVGNPASARDPGILEKQGVGYVKGSHITSNGKLKAEGWFDEELTARVDKRVLDSLKRNQPIELSTGLFTDNYDAPPGATHNGRPYDYVARNYRPDHLAILPDQVGACSLNDGCGVLINQESDKVDIGLLDNYYQYSVFNGNDNRDEHGRFASGSATTESGRKSPLSMISSPPPSAESRDMAKLHMMDHVNSNDVVSHDELREHMASKGVHGEHFDRTLKELKESGHVGHSDGYISSKGKEIADTSRHDDEYEPIPTSGHKKPTANLGKGNWHISKRREYADSLSKDADSKSENVTGNDDELDAYTAHKDAAAAHRNAARTAANGAANGGTPDYEAAGYHGNKAQYHANKAKGHGDKCALTDNAAGEEWITISGTHVLIDGGGNIIGGPEALIKHSAKVKSSQHGPPKPDRSTGGTTPDKKEEGSGEQGAEGHKSKPSQRHELPMADMGNLPAQKGEDKPAEAAPERFTDLGTHGMKGKTISGQRIKFYSGEHAGRTAVLGSVIPMRYSKEETTYRGQLDGIKGGAGEFNITAKTLMQHAGPHKEESTPAPAKSTPATSEPKPDRKTGLPMAPSSWKTPLPMAPAAPPGHSENDMAKVAKAFESGEMRAKAGALSQHSPEDIAGATADEHGAGIGPAKGVHDKTGGAGKATTTAADISSWSADALSHTAMKRTKAVKKAGTDVRRIKEHVKAGDAHLAAAEAHEKAGNHKQAEIHMAAALDHHDRAARGDPTSRVGVTANREYVKRFLTVNSNLLLKGSIMERQKAISFLTTNCRCWKGADDREVLNMMSDYKLNQLVASVRADAERQMIVNSVRQGISNGGGTLTLNAMPPQIQKALTKKVNASPAASEGGDQDQDGDKLTDDDHDEQAFDKDSADDATPDNSGRDLSQKAGKPPVNQKAVANQMTDSQWLASAPPRIRGIVENALNQEHQQRIALIQQIVANVAPSKREKHVKTLGRMTLSQLRDQLELINPGNAAPAIDYSLSGGYAPTQNAADDPDDILEIPVINWAEESSQRQKAAR